MSAAEQFLIKELKKGEKLLWSGIPLQGLRMTGNEFYEIPFSLMWIGFCFFWQGSAVMHYLQKRDLGSIFMVFWGVPFLLMGFYMLIGRYLHESYQRSRTYYGVTSDRIIILINGKTDQEAKSISLRNLDEMSVTERKNGNGDILFGRNSVGRHGSSLNDAPRFAPIAEVRKVYDLIKQAQQELN
ncbi:MAG TPA: hypothetical protein VL625_08550 [Patescibacteria group bacterium]|jgi:hypothetical protein|nr:hypothetical protein [Patescibacteria group bacterium]